MPATVPMSEDGASGSGCVQLQLLGSTSLWTPAEDTPHSLTGPDAALLARLVLDGPQARGALAALLWPDNDAASAATNLRQRIYRLKRMAGVPVVVGVRTLALAEGVQHDLHGSGHWSILQPEQGGDRLLGTHDFADNNELQAWLTVQRQQRLQHRSRFLSEGARTLQGQGRLAAAVRVAQALVREAPLDEPAHRLLIQLLHQSGDTAGALSAGQHCLDLLAAELGAKPSAATRDLLAQLASAQPPAPAPSRALPLSLLRPPQRVGRDAEWQQLTQAASAHQVLVLEGEAGMGKSRLLGDFVAAHPGWTLVSASPGDHALPFALLARLLNRCTAQWGRPAEAWVAQELARMVPEAGAPSADVFAPLRLQQAVRAALLHWQQGGLAGVALDDLHHADHSSTDLLLPLAGSTSVSGLPWLLASRPAAGVPGLDGLPSVRLLPLPVGAVEALLATLALQALQPPRADRWAAALLQRTGGNPLYLLQTLSAAFEAGVLGADAPPPDLAAPAPLSALLVTRLEKLSPEARAIARLASVAGADFTLQLACQLLQQTPTALADPWLELQTAHVMQDGGFAHDLIRDACAQITPPELRRLMHAQVAQALHDRHAPAAREAEHWDAAGRWPEAARAYERAAEHAHERNAVADELLKLQAASRCHRAGGHAHALAAAFATEQRALHLRVANNQLGDDTLQGCEALLAQADTDEQLAAAQVLLAYYWAELFKPERALPWAQAAMELATRGGLERQALLAAQRLGGALSRLGRHEEALLCMRPLSNSLQVLTRDERLNWRSDFGSALDYADHRREALQVLDAVVEEATPHGRLSVAAAALSLSSNVLGYLGRTQDGLRAAEQALVLYRRAGLEEAHLLVDESNQLGMLRDLGHFEAYLARAEHLPAAMRTAGSAFWAANTEHDLATAYAWLGRADLALRTLSAQPLDGLPPMMRAARLVTRSRLTRDYGVGGSAPGTSPQAMLQEAQALLAQVHAAGRSHFGLAVALQVARDAEPDSALATAAHLEAEGLRRENLILACSASGVRLRLLLTTGDTDGAAAVASRLLQHIDEFGSPPGNYAPELWWLAYQGLRSREPAAAQAALIQAVQWVRQRARDHVPEHHRESFLNRNPVNRAVLAAAQGLGL